MTSAVLSPRPVPASRSRRRRGFIVAAVHADSIGLDRTVARAIELSGETDDPVVFFTVVTQRPLTTEIDRLRRRLAAFPVAVSLVASWIDADGLSPVERSHAIAAEIVRGAAELAASAVVIGLSERSTVPVLRVAGRVARALPAETELCFGSAEPTAV